MRPTTRPSILLLSLALSACVQLPLSGDEDAGAEESPVDAGIAADATVGADGPRHPHSLDASTETCGDDRCGDGESVRSCPEDCPAECGDFACTHDETAVACPDDCPSRCGDGACTHRENAQTCGADCPAECGDELCTHDESPETCPGDCSLTCGDGVCSEDETATNCAADCPAVCGDGACTHDENSDGCPDDCTAADATFTIQGSVVAPDGTAIDSDVNNIYANYADNNTVPTSQPIPSPVTVTGYVNVPGAGPDGRSREDGDPIDAYRVSLVAGQTAQLFIAGDGAADDLDLCLYPESGGEAIACSSGTGQHESLTISASGDYHLGVIAFAGSSNYTLMIGFGPAAASRSAAPDAVPDEVIVRLAGAKTGQAAASLRRLAAMGLISVAGAPDREVLLSYRSLPSATALGGGLAAGAQPGDFRLPMSPEIIAKRLALRPEVEAAAPNYILKPFLVPNDNGYAYQWHYHQIGVAEAWDLAPAESDVIVSVIDTGVVLSHPDLADRLVPGYDFISITDISRDGNGIDSNPDDPGDSATPGGSSFHGTHVAGTIAAATDNGTGVAGVARNARIMPLRALGVGGGTTYDIMQCVRFSAGMSNDSSTLPERAANVINMSLGGPGGSSLFQDLIHRVRELGVVVVAAAGNEASSELNYPASYDGVISVSSVDMMDTTAPYSSYGSKVDVAAPGGDTLADLNADGYADGVLSTAASDATGAVEPDYQFMQGTSMASPHMAGVVALMLSVNSDLTPQDLDDLLAGGTITIDLGDPGRDDYFGHGRIDAHAAVAVALGTDGGTPPVTDPRLVVSPTALNFGTNANALTFEARNGGGGTLTVDPPTVDVAWLFLATSAGASGRTVITAQVDRSGLADGTYTASIGITSNGGSASIPVMMQVGTLAGDLGLHYILVTTTEFATVDGHVTNATDGCYNFVIDDLPIGDYYVFAGTDHNNDQYICDAGEACGAYPTLSSPSVISLTRNTSDVDFASNVSTGSITMSTAARLPPIRRLPTLSYSPASRSTTAQQ